MSKKLQPRILVVDDQDSISSIIKYNLEKEGFNICVCDDGAEGFELIKDTKPDLVILDWMLPSMTGIEVCQKIRKTPGIENTPVIMISARAQENDKVDGLNIGADDYLTKPFSHVELLARIRSIFRRLRPTFGEVILEYEDIKMDLSRHLVTRNGKELKLSPIEFKILQVLIEAPGRVFSRDALMDKIWGSDVYIGSRTIDVHITRLRKALLLASGDGIDIIMTVRLSGYTLISEKDRQSF